MPNLPDHDYPVKGYFLNVSGYMMLDNLKPSEDQFALEAGSFENQSQYDSVENREEAEGQFFIDGSQQTSESEQTATNAILKHVVKYLVVLPR